MDSMEATASLCIWPQLSEFKSIDGVLLNIKMRAQIKGIIAKAGRTRPELLEGDMVGQANYIFWLMMNELQDESLDLAEVYGWWCGWYEGGRFETVIIWVMANLAKTGY